MAWPRAAAQCHPDLVDSYPADCLVDAYFDDLSGITEAHGRTNRAATMFPALCLGRAGKRSLHGDCALVDQCRGNDIGERQA